MEFILMPINIRFFKEKIIHRAIRIYDEIIYISPMITKSGLQEVVFEQLTGKPSAVGNIVLSNQTRSITISIENEGKINW